MEKLVPFRKNLCSKYAEKMISIKLTSKCNGQCSFCVDRGGYTPTTPTTRDKPNVKEIIASANKFVDYETVIITGGEPFLLFDELINVLQGLRKTKKRLVVNTNGSLLTPEKVSSLNGLIDELQISIHHPDEEINNKIFSFTFNKDNCYEPYVHFEMIKLSLKYAKFNVSINTCFTKNLSYLHLNELVDLAKYLGANKIRFTELKKVGDDEFVDASIFYPYPDKTKEFCNRTSEELITKGCMTEYFAHNGIQVSVKKLCKYAKGLNAPAFSCCFINADGQDKIDVETKDTFKVIYNDGSYYDDWIFNGLSK